MDIESFLLKSSKLGLCFSLFPNLDCSKFRTYWYTLDFERSMFTHHSSPVFPKGLFFPIPYPSVATQPLLSTARLSCDLDKLLLQHKLGLKSPSSSRSWLHGQVLGEHLTPDTHLSSNLPLLFVFTLHFLGMSYFHNDHLAWVKAFCFFPLSVSSQPACWPTKLNSLMCLELSLLSPLILHYRSDTVFQYFVTPYLR